MATVTTVTTVRGGGKDAAAAKEHEAFKSRLVDDVLGQDVSDKVPMEKVIMLLWSFRDDPSVVTFMARFVQKYSGSRHVFDGIEFYLPQLAHMIIHLEVEWDDAILERLTLVIAQQSIHFALQFNWILQGALQDYHPETYNVHTNTVVPNPNYSPLFYSRCLKLLKNVERVVVYGKPRAQELQKLYETGKISKQEMQILELADRRFISLQITNDDDDAAHNLRHVGALDGLLLVKLPSTTTTTTTTSTSSSSSADSKSKKKKTSLKKKNSEDFVPRFCVLEKHVLNCYKMKQGCGPPNMSSNSSGGAGGKLDRAMSLEKANVQIVSSSTDTGSNSNSDGKNKTTTKTAAAPTSAGAGAVATTTTTTAGNMMEILVTTRNYEFRLRCTSPEECKLWARRLGEEADASALFPTHHHHYKNDKDTKQQQQQQQQQDESNLTSSIASTSTTTTATTTTVARFKTDLTPAQLDRYHFFQNERTFVEQLTRVAEDLRDQDRAQRKVLAPQYMAALQIPTSTAIYLPLCNSSDIWRRVHETIANETRVFNTKERCPTVMHFITKRGETVNKITTNSSGDNTNGGSSSMTSAAIRVDPNLDVAEYMHAYLDVNLDNEDAMDAAMTTKTSVIAEGNELEESKKEEEEEEEANNATKQQVSGISDAPAAVPQPHSQGVEISADGKAAAADDKDKSGDMVNSVHGSVSNVWVEEEEDLDVDGEDDDSESRRRRGNANRVQRMIRESVVTIPAKFAKKLNPRSLQQRRLSIMDQQTVVQPLVPILEGSRAAGGSGAHGAAGDEFGENASIGDGTVVSVERSSIMIKDTGTVLLGDLQEGDIDIESIDRAKQHVCGGEVWAEKSARMLEEVRKRDQVLAQGQNDDNNNNNNNSKDNVQLEIASCLAKSNDDLRQEVFVMQMIHYYKSVFAQAKLPLWLKTYRILSTSSSEGLLELLTDANSLDGIKKSEGYPKEGGLRAYFEKVYGGPDSKAFKAARRNFMTSLAGYAIVSYLLGLKDRHNGNIMLDTRGHVIFIDFGFALGMAPGHEFSMERAPFKLTKEMVQVMGGVGSDCYKEFETLFVAGFEEARKNYQIALGLVEIMMFKSNYPCFSGWRYGNGKALVGLEKRLMLHVPDKYVKRRALNLIKRSRQHFGTYLYDKFQQATNGYAM